MMKIAPGSIQLGNIPFDLYIQESDGRMLLFCRSGMPITVEHMNRLDKKNRIYFITSDEINEYLDYTFERIESIIARKDMRLSDKTRILVNVGKRIVRGILDNPESQKAFDKSRRLIKSTVTLILATPEASLNLIAMNNDDEYLFSHSINSCTFCLMLGLAQFGPDKDKLHDLGLGGLLMDIGMTMITKSIRDSNKALTDSQFTSVKRHPELGLVIMKKQDLPQPVHDMVKYHHERLDGSGYPRGLKGDEISDYVRIAMVADVYDALTTNRPYRQAKEHMEALVEMAGEIDKYDINSFKALLRVVLLNDDLIQAFCTKHNI